MYRIYPNWLDGTHRWLALTATGESKPVSDKLETDSDLLAVRIIKLHALLGTTIALTEPQVVDNPVIASLFGDPQFRAFLSVVDESEPKLFHLVVYPYEGDPSAWYKAPLYSLIKADRQSTPLHDPRAGVELARKLVEAQDFEATANDLLGAVSRLPDHFMLEGTIRATLYFYGRPAALARPAAKTRQQFYEILRHLNAPHEYQRHVEGVLRLLDRLEEPARHSRTRLFEALSRRGFERYRPAFSTVINAWNHAVDRAVANAGSVAMLPSGVPVGYLLGRPVDAWLPSHDAARAGKVATLDRFPVKVLQSDPTALDWGQLRKLVEQTASTRKDLALARTSLDPIRRANAATAHFDAIANNMPPIDARTSGMFWLTLGFSVGVAYGPALGVASGLITALLAQAGKDYRPEIGLLRRLQRRNVVSTLRAIDGDNSENPT